MRMLRGKLLLLEHEKREQEMAREKGEQKEIAWGSQIRSYVLAPYTLVKDHRTNLEKGNVDAVLNGAHRRFHTRVRLAEIHGEARETDGVTGRLIVNATARVGTEAFCGALQNTLKMP